MKTKRKMFTMVIGRKFHADIKSTAAKRRLSMKDYIYQALCIQLNKDNPEREKINVDE
jgi:predicted HicB family RNase H-like nuclease